MYTSADISEQMTLALLVIRSSKLSRFYSRSNKIAIAGKVLFLEAQKDSQNRGQVVIRDDH
jgi:hypothetical protein